MIEINGKKYRNIQEQVKKNMEDITELQSGSAEYFTAGDGINIDENLEISVNTSYLDNRIEYDVEDALTVDSEDKITQIYGYPIAHPYLKTAIIKGADGLFVITLMYKSANNSLPSDGTELFNDMTQNAICIATGTFNHPVQERQVVVQSITKATDHIRILGTPVGYGETEWDITLDPADISSIQSSLL